MNLDRFTIDDGRHLLQLVIDEDASTTAGTARFRAGCSCGRMPRHTPAGREQALAAHLAHVSTRITPSKGPEWLPLGARLAILAVGMLAVWGICYATGRFITQEQSLTGTVAKIVLAGSNLAGLALAFGLMVAVRRYIAPTRA